MRSLIVSILFLPLLKTCYELRNDWKLFLIASQQSNIIFALNLVTYFEPVAKNKSFVMLENDFGARFIPSIADPDKLRQ